MGEIHISCLEEKELLLAYYFIRKEKDTVKFSMKDVWNLWNDWWGHDFKIAGNPMPVLKNGHLVYRTDNSQNNMELLRKADKAFRKSYERIAYKVKKYDRCKMEDIIRKQRGKQRYKLKEIAGPMGFSVRQMTGDLERKYMPAHYIVTKPGIRKDGNY